MAQWVMSCKGCKTATAGSGHVSGRWAAGGPRTKCFRQLLASLHCPVLHHSLRHISVSASVVSPVRPPA